MIDYHCESVENRDTNSRYRHPIGTRRRQPLARVIPSGALKPHLGSDRFRTIMSAHRGRENRPPLDSIYGPCAEYQANLKLRATTRNSSECIPA